MMGSLSSALVVRKALRKFLMKTHPDFFDADMLRKSSNEQGLKLINSLVDAATTDTSQSAPALQLPPVVRIKMHYRNQPDREPFEFQLAVPPSLSGRTSQDFSSEALVKMLIAAGEAPPDLASDWNKGAKREEWVTLAALDADGLKKEMQLESFMLDPPRRARDGMGATTKAAWTAKTLEARLVFWKSRTSVHSRVKLFESHETLKQLDLFARQQTALFFRVYDFPVFIVPTDFAAGVSNPLPPPGTLIVRADDTVPSIAALVALVGDKLRCERQIARKAVSTMLRLCDFVSQRGDVFRLSLSDELVANPVYCCERLTILLESPLLSLLKGCVVAVSHAKKWALKCDALVAIEDETLPSIQLWIGEKDDCLDERDVIRAKYAINHARLRAEMVNGTSFVSDRVSLLLHNDFHSLSITTQVQRMQYLAVFVDELMRKSSAKSKLKLRIGPKTKQDVTMTPDGILELPTTFTVEQVKLATTKQ